MELSDHKPVGLTGRYINALFELCSEKNILNKVVDDFRVLNKLIKNNDEISLLISSPTIGKNDQSKLITQILEKSKANKISINFCGVLANNGRISILEKIVEEFLKEVSRRQGEITVDVSSTSKLEISEEEILKKSISQKFGGKKISLVTNVDKSLIGGIVIKIGSKMIDNSIKTKLKNLELVMKGES